MIFLILLLSDFGTVNNYKYANSLLNFATQTKVKKKMSFRINKIEFIQHNIWQKRTNNNPVLHLEIKRVQGNKKAEKQKLGEVGEGSMLKEVLNKISIVDKESE